MGEPVWWDVSVNFKVLAMTQEEAWEKVNSIEFPATPGVVVEDIGEPTKEEAPGSFILVRQPDGKMARQGS